ncbi:MAG: glycosyltransferase family 2 protein [Akkermansiaceae bacterium]|nr:glycosyltransferase family 2 protein [Akkermansiaceae bacterium]
MSIPEISCVIPAFNEAENIPCLLKELAAEFAQLARSYEVIIIDDGSRDHTAKVVTEALASYPLRLLKLSRNFGKESAITAGLAHAQGKAVIIMDADLQHPVSYIPRFLKLWGNGAKMVYAIRENRDDESFLKRKLSALFYQLMIHGSEIPVTPNALDFRLLDRQVVDALLTLPEQHRFMKGLYNWVGFEGVALPLTPANRNSGNTKFSIRGLIKFAVTGITSFSSLPLRMWTVIGGLVSLISILYALYVALKTFAFGASVPGWATITCAVFFLGGIQLISIGILGEYVGRIFDEVKRRPNYVIDTDSQQA